MYMRSAKTKLKLKYPKPYKMKTKKGLSKRLQIVGARHDRGFKYRSPGLRHKLRHKTANNRLRKRQPKYISKADLRHVKRMLPYHKKRKYKH